MSLFESWVSGLPGWSRDTSITTRCPEKDLSLAGRSFEGFPLLVGSDGWPVEPVQSFLRHILVESGEARSELTWEAYGRCLYDYFAFLEANGLE